MAGEVDNPSKTFPWALFYAVIMTCVGYIIPLVAVTGAVAVDQDLWEAGFMADAAKIISGDWLKIWVEIGAVLSAIGLFEAQLSSSAYQILGLSDLALLPKVVGVRSKRFNTPWMGILVSTVIALCVSYMTYTDIISSANFLYSLGMLLEFASFVYLRWKFPTMKRPYKVPLEYTGLAIMCVVPSFFLIYVMVIATKTVYLVSLCMTVGGMGWFGFMKICKDKRWLKFSRVVAVEEE